MLKFAGMEVSLAPAEDKLREAEFFFMPMNRHLDEYEFKYFLSAFLSALSGFTEHNRLYSRDARFKDWYRDIKNDFANTVLGRLDKLRNKEVHHKGTRTLQRVGFSTGSEEPITTTRLEFTVDFRGGRPKGMYQTAEMAAPEPIELTIQWVWDVEDSPDVMELCAQGLNMANAIIQDWRAMGFAYETAANDAPAIPDNAAKPQN